VNSRPDKPYKFPDGITDHMKATYEIPVIYRWVIDNEYYVGETVNLCKRIGNYLKAPKPKYREDGKMLPHQQTTNINLNADYAPVPITASNFWNSMNFNSVTQLINRWI
jgi:hypothetical protein